MSASIPCLCPVCGYEGLAEPPYTPQGAGSFEICPCCGFEFGFDDHSEGRSHQAWREAWLADGAPWSDPEARPPEWDRARQMENIPQAVAALPRSYSTTPAPAEDPGK